MAYTIRVSLPTYNALTETDPNKFALITSETQNYTIAKINNSFSGSISIPYLEYRDINHNLGYIPFTLVFFTATTTKYAKIYGYRYSWGWFTLTNSRLRIYNWSYRDPATFVYYIFYDQTV